MPVTEQQYQAYLERRKKDAPPPVDPLLEQAAVKAALLVGTPEWDWFLTRLQAIREKADLAAKEWLDRLSRSFDETSRCTAQVEYHVHHAVVQTLDEVIALPSQYEKESHAQP